MNPKREAVDKSVPNKVDKKVDNEAKGAYLRLEYRIMMTRRTNCFLS